MTVKAEEMLSGTKCEAAERTMLRGGRRRTADRGLTKEQENAMKRLKIDRADLKRPARISRRIWKRSEAEEKRDDDDDGGATIWIGHLLFTQNCLNVTALKKLIKRELIDGV
ncbi:unnamed protein product [Nippostrongylus brasiliensis]|uniref:Uncharacterized protein n=1 Tax=Nippostrongylus brasiliensis TaxID=27835 RepID=A0A0N4Y2L2_NIPBR|nr:unnamed protein product [Nippostrongylus brasiliensis]